MSKNLDPRRPFTFWERRIRYSYPVIFVEVIWALVYRKYDNLVTPPPVWKTQRRDVPRETSTD